MKKMTFCSIYLCLFIFIIIPFTSFAERYKPLRERSDSSLNRYESRSSNEKKRFDSNLNKYNRYSPEEKKQAAEKWKQFKQETTPEEREFIIQKLRSNRRKNR